MPITPPPGGGGSGAVDSVNGQTGVVVLAASNVGAANTAQGTKADDALALLSTKGTDIASSSASADIGASTGQAVDITGGATITAFPTATAGIVRLVRFTGALILTHNATSLQLPGAANITTAAGDVGQFESLGSGNWKCAVFQRASGKAVIPPAFADTTGFASTAQGALAASALQPSTRSFVWTLGAVDDSDPAAGHFSVNDASPTAMSKISFSFSAKNVVTDDYTAMFNSMDPAVYGFIIVMTDSVGRVSMWVASPAHASTFVNSSTFGSFLGISVLTTDSNAFVAGDYTLSFIPLAPPLPTFSAIATAAGFSANPAGFTAMLAYFGISPAADATISPVTSQTTVSGIVTADS